MCTTETCFLKHTQENHRIRRTAPGGAAGFIRAFSALTSGPGLAAAGAMITAASIACSQLPKLLLRGALLNAAPELRAGLLPSAAFSSSSSTSSSEVSEAECVVIGAGGGCWMQAEANRRAPMQARVCPRCCSHYIPCLASGQLTLRRCACNPQSYPISLPLRCGWPGMCKGAGTGREGGGASRGSQHLRH